MNYKKWVLTGFIAAIVIMAIEYVGHGVILAGFYQATATLWRPETEMTKLLPWGWLVDFVAAFILVYIYNKGYEEGKGHLAQGLRFGFVVGLFIALPMSVWTYISMPVTTTIAFGWFLISLVEITVAGTVIGLVYRR